MNDKHLITSPSNDKLKSLFNEMIEKTHLSQIKCISKHQNHISFIYLMGNTDMSIGPVLELPMTIVLIEDKLNTTFCVIEHYLYTLLDVSDITKLKDLSKGVLFINHEGQSCVASLFKSLNELDQAVDRVLNYSFLLVLDDLTFHPTFMH
jgi:hypothetical protein